MAEYPFIELDPVVESLKECIAALRTVQPMIAQPPRRVMFELIAERAQRVLDAAAQERVRP